MFVLGVVLSVIAAVFLITGICFCADGAHLVGIPAFICAVITAAYGAGIIIKVIFAFYEKNSVLFGIACGITGLVFIVFLKMKNFRDEHPSVYEFGQGMIR